MCCGKKREAFRAHPPASAAHAALESSKPSQSVPAARSAHAPVAQPNSVQPASESVAVRYTESQSIVVRGPVTGRRYAFSGASPIQSVDARDTAAILQARFFRRA
jgi:hypothetical protein